MSHDLVILTFDFLTMTVFHVQCFSCSTHIQIIIILRLSVTELRVLNIWLHFRYLKVNAHAPCHVTSNRGQKIFHIFEIPDPNLPIHFVTFRALRRRLKPYYRQKIAFSYYKGYKVYCACAASRDLCIGGPPKHP